MNCGKTPMGEDIRWNEEQTPGVGARCITKTGYAHKKKMFDEEEKIEKRHLN